MREGGTAPKFVQVAETIKSRIRDRLYRPGAFIPSAGRLEDEFQVSNITIRKALALLAREGYITPRRGVGTRVADRADELVEIEIGGDFQDWADSVSGRRRGLETDLLDLGPAPCPGVVHEVLGLGPDDPVWRLRRLRKLGREPVSYFLNYLRPETAGRLGRGVFRSRGFVEVLREVVGLDLKRMDQRVRAVPADLDHSAALEVDFGTPLFFGQTVYYSEAERAEAVTHMYYRGDRYVYRASMPL